MKQLFFYILLVVLFFSTRGLFAEEAKTAELGSIDEQLAQLSREVKIDKALHEISVINEKAESRERQKMTLREFYIDEKLRRLAQSKEKAWFFFIHKIKGALWHRPNLMMTS